MDTKKYNKNSKIYSQGRLSILEPLGDIDFYPNGGQHQPGCRDACSGLGCLEINLWDLFNGIVILIMIL